IGNVDACFSTYLEKSKRNFESYDSIILGPISLDLGGIPIDLTVPIIGMSHAFDINEVPESSEAFEKILKNLARFSHVIVDNSFIKTKLVNKFKFQKPVTIIPYGCDFEKFAECNPELQGNLRILSMRNWTKIHSNQIILEALSILKEEGIIDRAIFIGDGPELDAGKNFCREKNLNFLVEFKGFAETHEIIEAMNVSNVYVSASRSDGSSVSLMEAMAGGLISCVTNHPSNESIITNRENGFLYHNQNPDSLASTLREIYKLQHEERTLNSKNARIHAKSAFDWSHNKIHLQKTILEVIGGK
ncbi:MAG: glycosyltransferase, partial [Opitutaceae bacterium]